MLAALVLASVVATSAAAARAGDGDGKREAAQAALSAGNARFGREDFAGALAAYREAYALFPSAKLQFNIGQAQRALGHVVEATEAYESFLAECADASADLRAEADGYLRELRRQVGHLSLITDVDGAAVQVDGEPRGRTPLARALVVRAGERRVRIEKPGFVPRESVVAVAAGAEEPLTVHLEPIVLAPRPAALTGAPSPATTLIAAPAPKPVYRRWWFWTGVAALTAVAVAGAVYALQPSNLECPSTVQHCYTPN